jgi:hypothetical protein
MAHGSLERRETFCETHEQNIQGEKKLMWEEIEYSSTFQNVILADLLLDMQLIKYVDP